ncbi:MAG TPA: class II aldolase/adducin family protein [Stellaceae bacterium]|jgi:ribulose-5-phosphate 4-epimerase/fuculose-1-phosphate aldolase|nr:class II aldolase/adducin family protein [Stellaceae bacterium]
MTDIEQSLRHQVAAVSLLLNAENILGYSGHISVRIPGTDNFLIQPVDQSRAQLRPEHLLVCGMDGKSLERSNRARPPSEVYIHTEIFRARPDVNAVAHFHHDLTTTFSLVEGAQLVPIKNHAVRWESGIPTHADPSHVSSPELGRSVAETLGPHQAMLIRAHGQVVVAEDLPSLLSDCVHFVENAEALYRAATLGKVLPLTAKEMEAFHHDFRRDSHAAKLWSYYVGKGLDGGTLPRDWARILLN